MKRKVMNPFAMLCFGLAMGNAVFLFCYNQEGFTVSRVKNPDAYLSCCVNSERIHAEDRSHYSLYIQHRTHPAICPIVRGTDWSSGLFS